MSVEHRVFGEAKTTGMDWVSADPDYINPS